MSCGGRGKAGNDWPERGCAAIIPPAVNATEPHFEPIRTLGTGASSTVELVRLVEPFAGLEAGSEVALKRVRADLGAREREEAIGTLEAEAEAGARVRHPSLVRVLFDGTDAPGDPYLLLSFVPGRSLREALDEGVLPEPLVRSIGVQLSGALAALHAAGLVHGDIKPENARLCAEGTAVLLDLGFASSADAAAATPHRGSLAYLSPERARGEPATPASDVFALGATLYELVCGVHPFGAPKTGTTPEATRDPTGLGTESGALLRSSLERPDADRLLASISAARYVPPSHLDLFVTPFLDQLLEQVLMRDPAARPSAAELTELLREGEASAWWRERVDVARQVAPSLRPERHLTRLVGRSREMKELESALESARAGRTELIWIGGAEGTGKWRLVSEFAARARTSLSPPLYLYARWNPTAESLPAGAPLLLLHRWLRLPTWGVPGERERRLLTKFVGPDTTRTLLDALTREEAAEGARESVPAALARWIHALAADRTIILFLDDLESAGPVTRESLHNLFTALGDVGGAGALILLGVREEARDATASLHRLRVQTERLAETKEHIRTASLHLEPLTPDDLRELVDELFASSVPRGRLAEVLWRRSSGNPGLATEILRDLVRLGHAHPPDGAPANAKLVLDLAPDELPKPRSLDRLIAERLEALDPRDRRWLERLAVVGGRISPEFLLRAFPPGEGSGPGEVNSALSHLVHAGWLVPVARRYRFSRPALREALYRSLPEGRRRRLHLAAAMALAESPPEEAGSDAEFQEAFHLHQAHEWGRLLDLVVELIQSQRLRASPRRLLALARRGLDAQTALGRTGPSASEEDRRLRLELLEVATDAADRLGHRAEERRLLDDMLALDLDLDASPAEGARLYLLHARYAASTGSFGFARGLLKNAVDLARASGAAELESETLRRLALVQAQVGEFDRAREHASRALDLATGTAQLALARLAGAQIDVLTDRLEPALAGVEDAVHSLRAEPLVPLGIAAFANLLRARVWRALGRPVRAMASARRAVRLARRAGERRLLSESHARLGALLLDLDHPSEAEAELRDAQLLADEIEDRRGQVLAQVWLGLLLLEEEDSDARAMIQRGTDLAHEIGFYRAEAFALATLARLDRQEGADPKDADTHSREALEITELRGAELTDRIVIMGTRSLILSELGEARAANALRRSLSARIAKSNSRIRDPRRRARQLEAMQRLEAAVLSPEGPVLPRTRVSLDAR